MKKMTPVHFPATLVRLRAGARALNERRRRALPVLLTALLVALFAQLARWQPSLAANLVPPPAVDATSNPICEAQSNVPASECNALVALHEATEGAGWLKRGGWLTATAQAPCDWFGVTCSGGHVSGLSLASNRLSGTLPLAIGALSELKTLQLGDNAIGGGAPRSLCFLTDSVTEADFSYNRLRVRSPQSDGCLTTLDADWKATQTTPPTDLRIAAITTSTVSLAWTPLQHPNSGGYRISLGNTPSGPWSTPTLLPSLATSTYTIPALQSGRSYWIRVQSGTQAGGGQSSNLISEDVVLPVVTASTEKVLVAVFFAADNDLTAHAPIVLERLRRGSLSNPAATIVYLVDEAGPANSTLYLIAGGVVTPTTAVADAFGTPEIDSADPDALAWFLNSARARVPGAAREIVSILGHGVGLMPEYTLGTSSSSAPFGFEATGAGAQPAAIVPLPREKEATPTDFTSGNFLSTHDLADALANATAGGAQPFDLLFLDQCFGGSLDLLYEIRSAAEHFVASPNYAWLAAPYDRYLATFAPQSSPELMGRAIIGIYQMALDNSHPNAIVSISRAEIETALAGLSTLADRLIAGLANPGAVNQLVPAIALATQQSRFIDTALCGDNGFALEPPDEQVGIVRFARVLSDTIPSGAPDGIQGAAAALVDSMATVERSFRTGSPYVAPEEVWLYDDALTILAPLLRGSPAAAIWRSTIYRPDAPFSAIYAPAPELPLRIERSFASTQDGRWDEFLDAWYTAESPPTVGQWCRYTPSALVISDSAGIVGLTIAQPKPGTLTFSWSPAAQVATWQLYVRLPQRRGLLKGWTLLATLPAGATTAGTAAADGSYTVDEMPPGEFAARLAGIDAEGTVTVFSEATPFTVDERILLPIVRGEP